MSRVAKKPIAVPKGVDLTIQPQLVSVKGPKGTLSIVKPAEINVNVDNGIASLSAENPEQIALTGTLRAIVANMVHGVSQGFERKLELVGVGYRAAVQGKDLNLTLGFSHPVVFKAPEGITITTPTQTEVVVQGADKQLVGQVAAKIRSFRPPEPYKGKGVKYSDETIIRKEARGFANPLPVKRRLRWTRKKLHASAAPNPPARASASSAFRACRCCAPGSICMRRCLPPMAPRCWLRPIRFRLMSKKG